MKNGLASPIAYSIQDALSAELRWRLRLLEGSSILHEAAEVAALTDELRRRNQSL